MAIYLKKYNQADTYLSPSGAIMNAAKVLNDYPAAAYFTYVVQTDSNEEMMFGFYHLNSMLDQYGIDKTLPEADAIAALVTAMEAEQEPVEGDPTPEERIAAALEFQVMNNLPDEEEGE